MLTMTDNAATAIRDITSQDAAPPGAGLRISADESGVGLVLSLAAEPLEGDQVVDSAGARLFLDQYAAALLADKELDVTIDPSGDLQFAVADQWPPRPASASPGAGNRMAGEAGFGMGEQI
jgi:Fe-S cluster assembly iron-binding protein IscA